MSVVGIDHVQLAMPRGHEAEARAFYTDLLGLDEVPKPAALVERGGCWFVGHSVAVHLGVEEPFAPARKAHPAFIVPDLDRLMDRARSLEIAILPDRSGVAIRRCYLADPFGNRIELVDQRDAGFTARQST